MKKLTVLFAATLVAAVTFGQVAGAKQESLASARAKITQVIENPTDMTAIMKTMSASNQVVFLSEVLTAISTMPGDESARSDKYVEVVNAALAGAQKGYALMLISEVFAKVPVGSLAQVAESLSAGLMNRANDRSRTYTDAQYIDIARAVMEKVNERVASEDNAGVRSGFAAVMLIRGSNSESQEIMDAVAEALPEAVRKEAKTDWLPSALGQGREKSYDPMLAAAEGDVAPSSSTTRRPGEADGGESIIGLRVSGIQNLDSLLADIAGASTDPTSVSGGQNPFVDAVQNNLNRELPNIGNGEAADSAASAVSEAIKDAERRQQQQEEDGPEEPRGYQNQTRYQF